MQDFCGALVNLSWLSDKRVGCESGWGGWAIQKYLEKDIDIVICFFIPSDMLRFDCS